MSDEQATPEVSEHAEMTVAYVERALGVRLGFDSETLPVLDHYLRSVPSDQAATVKLVASTAGAYFGEVVRRHLGGRWEATGDPERWRFILPSGLSFVPARYAMAAVLRADSGDEAAEIDAPAILRQLLEDTLAAMGEVTEETFYSLCGRLDTLEHVHEVAAGYVAQEIARQTPAEPDDDAEPDPPARH